MTPPVLREITIRLYEHGADGLLTWQAQSYPPMPRHSEIDVARMLVAVAHRSALNGAPKPGLFFRQGDQ